MKFIFSLIKWLFVVLLGIPIVLYVILILFNLDDENKSKTVIEFENFLAQRATVDDKNNGFVYAAGISANPKKDFYLVGLARINQANTDSAISEYSSEHDLLNIANLEKHFESLLKRCGSPVQLDADCNAYLLEKIDEVDQLLIDSAVLIHRYQIMINQPQWYESIQTNIQNILSIKPWNVANKIFMLHVWREATKANVSTVTQLLEQDSVFWRNTMSSTQYLLHFMVITSVMKNHYQWGLFTLNNLSKKDSLQAVTPKDWHLSFLEPPFLFDKIAIGEWKFASSLFQEITESKDWFSAFLKPLFKMQSTLNLQAEILFENMRITESSEDKFSVSDNCQKELSLSLLYWWAYNPVGKVFTCIGSPSFQSYEYALIETEQARLEAISVQ